MCSSDLFTLAIALLVLSVGAFVLMLRQEKRAPAPLLPINLYRQPSIWRSNGMAFCNGAAVTALFAFLPLYMRVSHGASPSQVGLILLPVTIAIGVGSVITGRLITRTGRTMLFPSVGLIFASLFLLVFAFLGRYMDIRQLLIVLCCASFFMGTVMSVVQVAVQTDAGRKAIGAAAGSVQFSRTVGAAFGVASLNTVLFATLALADPEGMSAFARTVDDGPGALAGLDAARRVVLEGHFAAAFRNAFIMLAGFTVIGNILAITNPSRRI